MGSTSSALVVADMDGDPGLFSCCSDPTYSQVFNLSPFFTPGEGFATDPDGTTHEFMVTFRDFETGDLTLNVIRKVRLAYVLTGAAGTDPCLRMQYGEGDIPASDAIWGDPAGEWGVGFGPAGDAPWTAGGAASSFKNVTYAGAVQYAPPDEGIHPFDFKVNSRQRFGRFRVFLDCDEAETVKIERIEQHVRLAGNRRR